MSILVGDIKKIIETIYNDKDLRGTCIPLFLSNPGLGKTTIVTQFAKEKNIHCLVEIASTKMPHEFSGVAIPDHTTKRMTYFDYDALLKLKDGDILFLDELLNTNPMILNAFLTVLENRTLPSGHKLADIMIIAAANPQGASMLTPQIKERFIWYDVKFDINSWRDYMVNKYLLTDEITDSLTTLITTEAFGSTQYNYLTPRSIDKAVNMIIKDVETPYDNKIKILLKKLIHNNSDTDIDINGYNFAKGEALPWLTIQQKRIKNETITE